jgi:hypothetical protein
MMILRFEYLLMKNYNLLRIVLNLAVFLARFERSLNPVFFIFDIILLVIFITVFFLAFVNFDSLSFNQAGPFHLLDFTG